MEYWESSGFFSLALEFEASAAVSISQSGFIEFERFIRDRGFQISKRLEDEEWTPGRGIHTIPLKEYSLVLLSDRAIPPSAFQQVFRILQGTGVRVQRIRRLENGPFYVWDWKLRWSPVLHPGGEAAFQIRLTEALSPHHVDFALQPEGILRRAKRLWVFDMDSTLIQNEVIDEFAREMKCYPEVAALTKAAMEGRLAFEEAFAQRCALLKGLTRAQVNAVVDRVVITPGARELLAVVKKMGGKIGILSGGFRPVADRLVAELGIDFAETHEMEWDSSDRFSGRILNTVMTAERKLECLKTWTKKYALDLDQVVAVGDGANDIPIIKAAGLGVAFCAKPVVRAQARVALNVKSLLPLLYFVGITTDEARCWME